MVNYSCEKCGKEFNQKTHYTRHLNTKKPCEIEEKVVDEKVVDEKVVDEKTVEPLYNFENTDGIHYLNTIKNDSIDLILTDPPYIISKDTGMNTHYNKVKENEHKNISFVKSEDDWLTYKFLNKIEDDKNKDKYLKYGTIYGKKYCVKTDYGSWDSDFTIAKLEEFIQNYYNKLRQGGTLIIFFDLWKIETLKNIIQP